NLWSFEYAQLRRTRHVVWPLREGSDHVDPRNRPGGEGRRRPRQRAGRRRLQPPRRRDREGDRRRGLRGEADQLIVSFFVAGVALFGSVSVSTPFSYFADAFDSSRSDPSENVRATEP